MTDWIWAANEGGQYFNDFDFDGDGNLVVSEPSAAYSDRDFPLAFLDDSANGRHSAGSKQNAYLNFSLYLFDRTAQSLRRIAAGFALPNGVQTDSSKEFVYVAEFKTGRILK